MVEALEASLEVSSGKFRGNTIKSGNGSFHGSAHARPRKRLASKQWKLPGTARGLWKYSIVDESAQKRMEEIMFLGSFHGNFHYYLPWKHGSWKFGSFRESGRSFHGSHGSFHHLHGSPHNILEASMEVVEASMKVVEASMKVVEASIKVVEASMEVVLIQLPPTSMKKNNKAPDPVA